MALMHMQHHRHLLVIDGPKVYGLVSMRDLVYQLVSDGHGPFRGGGARCRRRIHHMKCNRFPPGARP